MNLLKKTKKILFVTGTRADFGKIEPLAHALNTDNFEISFFITGMHMLKKYGETKNEVKRFPNAKFFEFVNQKEEDCLDFILTKTIASFSDLVHEQKPDLVIIHGDRVESFAASIVCSMKYIRSAHIEGGEFSGTIDESIRHCNTKLCHSHFVSSEEAKNRVLQLGENEKATFIIGSPELEVHRNPSGIKIEEVKKRYSITFKDFGIVIFHPVTSEIELIYKQAENLFNALIKSKRKFVVIAPNNDPGSETIFKKIKSLPKENFRIIPSMRFKFFSELLKNASLIIGNSSCGVREAPFIGLPSINIGTRQNHRTCSSIIDNCEGLDESEIISLLNKKWGLKQQKSYEFGDGYSSNKFSKIINSKSFWELPLQKYYSENFKI